MTAGWGVDLFWSEVGRDQTARLCLCRERKEGGRSAPRPATTPTHHRNTAPVMSASSNSMNNTREPGARGLTELFQQHASFKCREKLHLNPIFLKLILLKSRLKVWLPKIWWHKLSFDWMCHIYVPHKELLSIYCNQQLKSCSGLITFSFTLMIYHFKNPPLRCLFPFLIQIYIRLKKTILSCERLLSH